MTQRHDLFWTGVVQRECLHAFTLGKITDAGLHAGMIFMTRNLKGSVKIAQLLGNQYANCGEMALLSFISVSQ